MTDEPTLKHADSVVTRGLLSKTLARYTEGLADQLAGVLKKLLAGPAVGQRFDALEQRIKALEHRPVPKYAGTWKAGETYTEGHLVTHAGGLWLATEGTKATPGAAGSGFRLIVKRGQA